MTLAAGFRCSDGIVLCTDSQMTALDGTKYNAQKIFEYEAHYGHIYAVFAFAGIETFSRMCIERLAKCVLNSEPAKVEEALRDEAFAIHEAYAPLATADSTGYVLDVLVAVKFQLADGDELSLYHIEGPAVSPIQNFVCIGMGRAIGRQAATLFYREGLTVIEASRIGIYCVQQAKDHVYACGGPSQVTLLWDDTEEEMGSTSPLSMQQSDILEVETGFTALFVALRPVFLSLNSSNTYDPSFPKHLKDAANTIKKIWNKTSGRMVRLERKDQRELEQFIKEQNKSKGT